ncbi:DUF192 domain-containing protein [Candidatus Woesearchaeota archaeon]|nr:DUF192 domain-containing protein [Candidatus Woesearchaeota archaeon]
MEIRNETNGKGISDSYKICQSSFSKFLGLMFSRKKNLLFVFEKESRASLHMLFVFFPIWAIYLNERKETLVVKKLFPFISYFRPKQKAKYIIELVEEPKINIGDKIRWKE